MELLTEYLYLSILRWLCQWIRHIIVWTPQFESLCNYVGKIIHKKFHVIALLGFLNFFFFCLGFLRYIPIELLCRYIPMVLPRKKIRWINIFVKYQLKKGVGNSIGIYWISGSETLYFSLLLRGPTFGL